MSHEERVAWIASLVEGDEVAVELGGHTIAYAVGEVKGITRGGKFDVLHSGTVLERFDKDGTRRTSAYTHRTMCKLTDDIRETHLRQKLLYRINNKVMWSKMPTAHLQAVLSLVKNEGVTCPVCKRHCHCPENE